MADVEGILIPWLRETIDVRVVTDLPADLADVLPVVQLTRIGGFSHDDNPRFDMPTLSADCYAEDRGQAIALAESVDEAFRIQLPGQTLNRSTVTRVQTVTGASWRPYDNTSLRRVGASYRLYIKSRS
jgi:hypothetical protein